MKATDLMIGDWEKIERYFHKYQWKPSDEQMWALDVALENVCHQNDWAALDSLRTALQKLL